MRKNLDALVLKQQKNLERLLSLSKELLDELTAGEVEEKIDQILTARQEALKAISELDPELKKALEDSGNAPDPRFERFQKMVEEITRLDGESEAIMARQKTNVSSKMATIQKGSAALKGYGPGNPQGARHISIRK